MTAAGLAFHNVRTIPPVGYLDMVALEAEAAAIATDSGGVQKEAYFFKKPCVIARSETEWIEIVEAGAGIIADADLERLAYNECNSFKCSDGNPDDIYQLMVTLDRRFMAGLAYFMGVRKLGASIIRVGNGMPELQWDFGYPAAILAMLVTAGIMVLYFRKKQWI